MVGANIVYGISLTGEFGDPQEAGVSGELLDWVQRLQDDSDERDDLSYVQSHFTAEDDWLVAGIAVEPEKLDDPTYAGSLRAQWDEAMKDVEPERLEAILALGPPTVQVIYGKY
jgi:hypothetical protein